MKRFNDKVFLITGGAGDIGSAVARRLAEEGGSMFLTDFAGDKLSEKALELKDHGAAVQTCVCDVCDWEQTRAMVDDAASWQGGIDFLFNNAGYQGLFKQSHTYPRDDFARVIEVNLIGAFHVFRAVADIMVKQQAGAIVNTASLAATVGPPNMIAYASSKAGVLGLTRTAAKDLAPYNIRVNAISPGLIGPGYMWQRQVELQAAAGSQYYDSDPEVVADQMIKRVPMRRCGALNEIAGVVAFLFSEDSSYLTGANIPISGGIL